MTTEEFLNLIDFLDKVRRPAELRFASIHPDPAWNMIAYLMRRHLTGKLVTQTSLARAASVPYTTALRRIDELTAEGLLVQRPRTRTGLSHSLHPSRELIDKAFAYAQEVKVSLGTVIGLRGDPNAFYLGASHLSARIIPGPPVLAGGLGAGQTLTVLLYDDPSFFLAESLQEEISHLLGGNVRFEHAAIDELRVRTLANSERRISEFDIVAVDLPWVGEYAARKTLLPLNELIQNSEINVADFHPAEWNAARVADVQYGIPLQTMPEVLFCRRDMFEAHGIEFPSTMDQVLNAARRMHSPKEHIYGVAWTGAKGTPIGQAFIQMLAACGQPVINLRPVLDEFDALHVEREEFRPQIDTAASRQTVEFMANLTSVSPPDVLEMSFDETIALVRDGRVAMAYEWTARASRFEFDLTSPARGNVVYLPHPIGSQQSPRRPKRNVSPIGGFVLAIPANLDPKRRVLAWRALEWFTSPEVMKLFVQHGGLIAPRFSVAADPEVRSQSPVIAAVDEMAKRGQLRLWPRPPIVEFPSIVAILGDEIHAVLSGNQSIKQGLGRAQSRVDALMRANGRY